MRQRWLADKGDPGFDPQKKMVSNVIDEDPFKNGFEKLRKRVAFCSNDSESNDCEENSIDVEKSHLLGCSVNHGAGVIGCDQQPKNGFKRGCPGTFKKMGCGARGRGGGAGGGGGGPRRDL